MKLVTKKDFQNEVLREKTFAAIFAKLEGCPLKSHTQTSVDQTLRLTDVTPLSVPNIIAIEPRNKMNASVNGELKASLIGSERIFVDHEEEETQSSGTCSIRFNLNVTGDPKLKGKETFFESLKVEARNVEFVGNIKWA